MLDAKIVHISGKKFDLGGRNISIFGVEKCLSSMFPYIEKYEESESDIRNNSFLCKLHQTCQNAFEMLGISKISKTKNVFYLIYIYIYIYIYLI